MMSFSCFLDKNFVTPNSIHLSHSRVNKLDADLVDQPSCMCLPVSSMPFTDCILLWCDGGCRHEFTAQVFEHLSEPQTIFGCLLGIIATTPKVFARSRNFCETQRVASTNKSMLAVSPNSLSVQGRGVMDGNSSSPFCREYSEPRNYQSSRLQAVLTDHVKIGL